MSRSTWFLSGFSVGVMALGVAFLAGPAGAQDWKGAMDTVDGVVEVQNPAEAMLPVDVFEPEELWRIGGDSDDENEFFGVIGDFLTDDENNIYIVDTQLAEVRVFDELGNYVRTIGREGEGPGEFRNPNALMLMPSGKLGVLQPFPSRVILFDTDGNPAGDLGYSPEGEGFLALMGGSLAGDRLAIVYANSIPEDGQFRQESTLAFANEAGEIEAPLHTASSIMKYADSHCVETEWNTFARCWGAAADGRVFARNAFEKYEIMVWGDDGALERVIRREYPDHKRDSKDIEDIKTRWATAIARWVQNPSFDIEPNWNPIESLHPRNDGTLWVRTSRGARDLDEGIMASFDVFDPEGRYLQEIVFKGEFDPDNDGLFLTERYAFVVTDLISAQQSMRGGGAEDEEKEEEPEPMSVICYRVAVGQIASR